MERVDFNFWVWVKFRPDPEVDIEKFPEINVNAFDETLPPK